MALSAEVGELSALFRWVPGSEADAAASREPLRQAVKDEIGDVGILLLLLCARLGVDPIDVITAKLDRNARNYPVDAARGKAERPSRQPPAE